MKRVVVALSLTLAACGDCNRPAAPADEAGADASRDASATRDGDIVNATPLPLASVAEAVNPKHLPVYKGEFGSVEGTVTVIGDPPVPTPFDFKRCPDAEQIYGESFRKDAAGGLADAIVVATGFKGFLPEKNDAKQITITGCGYDVRTVTMTFGQRLEVKNKSTDFWTPTLEPQTSSVLMMAAPNGADPVKLYPKKAGHWLLLDHDRKYVVVDVYAFLHPLHTATDLTGHYRIDGVPVGPISLGVTHPRFDAAATVDVDVKPGVISRVDVVLNHKHVDAGAPGTPAPAIDSGIRMPH